MSISTLQEKFFNKGCGTVLIVAAAIAMAASIFTRNSGSSSQGPNPTAALGAVVTVGNVPVPAELIQTEANRQQTQAMQQQADATHVSVASLGVPDAGVQAMALVRATGTTLQRAAVQALLIQNPASDAELSAVGRQIADAQIDQQRTALVAQGKLKAGATDAELEKALKDVLKGKTLAQLREEDAKALVTQFKDPVNKGRILEQFGGPLLVERLGEKAVGSDQALRDSYREYVVRRVFLSAASGSKETPEARAAKVEAKLKAGKSFEAEMDAMSNDAAPRGKKKVSESIETVPASLFASRPELASLKGQAPKAVTSVVDVQGGKAIYQLVSVQDNFPKDFDKDKEKLRAAKIRTEGTAAAESAIKAYLAGGSVRWQSPGYQALAATFDALSMGFATDPAAVQKAVKLGEAALKSDNPSDRRLGTQALLAATDKSATIMVKPTDAAANRLVALEAARANGITDGTLMLELAGLYGDKKDGAKATEALIDASKGNSDYGTKGQRTFGDIAAKALSLQGLGVLTKAQLQAVQFQQTQWTSARVEDEKAQAQAKTGEADQQKANEAEIARQKAEAAKTAPAPTSTDQNKANSAEIARQKGEATPKTSTATTGGSLLPTTAGSGK